MILTPPEPAALAALFEHFRPRLRQMVRLRMEPRLAARVDASDVVQQAILQAHEAQAQFRGTTEAERLAWLRTILANVLAAAARRFERGGGSDPRAAAARAPRTVSLCRGSGARHAGRLLGIPRGLSRRSHGGEDPRHGCRPA